MLYQITPHFLSSFQEYHQKNRPTYQTHSKRTLTEPGCRVDVGQSQIGKAVNLDIIGPAPCILAIINSNNGLLETDMLKHTIYIRCVIFRCAISRYAISRYAISQHSILRYVICGLVTLITILSQPTLTSAQSITQSSSPLIATANYPTDPPRNIEWSAGESNWQDIADAFNAARRQESELLGLQLSAITLPSVEIWASMSYGERVLWLVNDERVIRGLPPLQGLETNVTAVAQSYAQYLLAENLFAHDGDGRSPHERLHANPVIGACYDFLGISENLYLYASSGTNTPPLLIERMVYQMLYNNADSGWGHRHALLWSSYTENSGESDREGFLGVGIAQGSYTLQGRFYQNAHMIVLNFFDPCATWVETAPVTPVPTPINTPSPTASPAPIATSTPPPPHMARTLSGRVVLADEDDSGNQRGSDASGLADVTVIIRRTGTSDVVVQTNAVGDFITENLEPGVYTLIPSRESYTFAPTSITVNLIAGSQNDLSFWAKINNPVGSNHSYFLRLPLIRPD